MGLVYPPLEVFQLARVPNAEPKAQADVERMRQTQQGHSLFNWKQTVCPPEGGMYSYFHDHPYPLKGHTYPEACEHNNTVKKLTMLVITGVARPQMFLPLLGFAIIPWKFKIRWLNYTLEHYWRMAAYICRDDLMKKQFYNNFSRELWSFTTHFLRNLGIEQENAYYMGRVVAHAFEHEDAYRLRGEDIFSVVDKDAMLKNPRKEILRVLEIYLGREKLQITDKFQSVARLLSLAMYLPRVKKAFVSAFEDVQIENLRLDKADKYFACQRDDYDFMGEDKEVRVQKFIHEYNKYSLERFRQQILASVNDPEALQSLTQQLSAIIA